MKKMKKIFAVILSLAMVLGMSLTAFAATPVNITVNLPEGAEGAELRYVRIVKPDRTSKDGWTFDNGYSEEKLGMSISELLAAGSTETENKKANDNKNAEAGVINTTTKLGSALDKVDMTANNVKTATVTERVATIPANEAGLYVICAEKTGWTFTRMLAYVAYQENSQELVTNTTVTAKGAKDGVSKELNDPILDSEGNPIGDKGFSVTKNDTVKYKVTHNYPYYDADQTVKKFIITDTLTHGKFPETVEDTLKVEIRDKEDKVEATLVKGTNYTIERTDENKIKLDLGGNFYNPSYAGKKVVITYDVIVTEVTSQLPLENDVESITTKDYPAMTPEEEIEDNTSRFKIVSPSVKADIQKLGENSVKLAGAEFTLYVKVDADATHVRKQHKTIAKLENGATPKEGEVGLKVVEAKETVGADGIASFDGLDAQKEYYVVETKAPEGYSLNTEAYKLVMPEITSEEKVDETIEGIKYDKVTYYKVDSDEIIIEGRTAEGDRTINDTKLSSLPSTGGIGTTIFTIGGCAIMIIAAGLFFASRRKSTNAK